MIRASVRTLLSLAVGVACCWPVPAVAAEPTGVPLTPAQIVESALDLDGTVVTVQGEAIGEDLRADRDHRWVNVLGEGTAVGVFMTNEQAGLIGMYGDHKNDGDVIEVKGVFNRVCSEHAGEFDIHAEQVTVVSAGARRETSPQPWKGLVGLGLIAVAFAEYRLYRHLRDRRPR